MGWLHRRLREGCFPVFSSLCQNVWFDCMYCTPARSLHHQIVCCPSICLSSPEGVSRAATKGPPVSCVAFRLRLCFLLSSRRELPSLSARKWCESCAHCTQKSKTSMPLRFMCGNSTWYKRKIMVSLSPPTLRCAALVPSAHGSAQGLVDLLLFVDAELTGAHVDKEQKTTAASC